MTKDPYQLNPDAVNELYEKTQGKMRGIPCPKKHENAYCGACEHVQALFASGDEDDKERAYEIMHKTKFYVCAVKPSEPDNLLLVELGKKVGNQIIEKVRIKDPRLGWHDICNPKSGLGRCITITKGKDGKYNTYSASIMPDKADFDIPEAVLARLPDLADIIDILDTESDDWEFFDIADMKDNDILELRLCPDKVGAERNHKFFINAVWRHWGVSEDDVRNGMTEPVEKDTPEPTVQTPVAESTSTDLKNCFGQSLMFDASDAECRSCAQIKACQRKIINEG